MTKILHRALAGALSTAVVSGMIASGAIAAEFEKTTLQMAHIYAPGNIWYETAERLAKNVSDATGGQVTFNIAHSGSTGTWAEQIEALTIGTNDVVLQSVGTLDRYAPLPGIEAFPYLVRDLDHFKAVYYGEVGAELFNEIETATGFKISGAGYRGARVLTANRAVNSVEELKGLKLRVPPLKMYTRTWELLEAGPTPMPFAEVFTSLQQGVIDGQENPYEVIESNRLDEVQTHVMETNHVIGAMTFIYDSARFKSFSPELQKVLDEASQEAMLWATGEMLSKEDAFRQTLTDRGMTILPLDLADFRAKVAPIKDEFPELAEWVTKISNVK